MGAMLMEMEVRDHPMLAEATGARAAYPAQAGNGSTEPHLNVAQDYLH